MRHVYSLLLGCMGMMAVCAQQPNDHIFPAAAVARASINFDKAGFFVNGKRTFLVSAGMEYARVPRALWTDRLLRLQRGGFNCVEVYTFWNIHEPREGVFDFKGENDLDAFLKLVKKMGMYAIVRVGPYYCAEWDNGGYPLWLKFKPGLKVREPNVLFEKYVGLFFDKLLPIVLSNQVHKGGAVIMVQLENEHPAGWGTDEPNSYFSFLRRKALALGLEVPYFFSGLHHDSDPAGDRLSLRDPARPNPWFSTEFWSVWYNGYGSGDSAARVYERRTWKIIARGGGGYNYYMAHGGSNFGYTNNDEDAASYDYGAAVGQAGDLRPIYYAFKRAAYFARSFAAELSAPNAIGFLDSAGSIMPVVHDCALTGTVRLVGNTMPILGKFGATLVVYGKAGSEGRLNFLNAGKRVSLEVGMPLSGEPVSYRVGQVRVLVMNTEMADRCWIIGDRIIVGPRYVGRVEVKEGHLFLETEDTVGAVVYTAAGSTRLAAPYGGRVLKGQGVLGSWQRRRMTGVAAIDYNDSSWKYSEWPLQMGADGNTTANAWYRTRVTVDEAGLYTLLVEGADRAAVFVDGRPTGAVNIKDGAIPLQLSKGRHVLAMMMSHDGRDKLAAYIGGMDSVARKGLFGRALLVKGGPAIKNLTDWRVLKGEWKPYKIGEDVFDKKQGTAWFETMLPNVADGVKQAELRFSSVDENAVVYLNDRKILRHDGWNMPFNILIDRIDTMKRPIRLAVFVENYSNEGGIDQAVRFSPWVSPVEVRGWRMMGGVSDSSGTVSGPCLWKTDFTVPENPGLITVWRVVTAGLGHGSVWVNGHNLGRYPEKIPVNGVYVPECWLLKGKNSLMIFDEDGASVGSVRIEAEVAASRPVCWLSTSGPAQPGDTRKVTPGDVLHLVNPMIGTAKSDVFTRWGDEGGTYPGAVAPSGYMQLSPETRRVPAGGYDFHDSLIYVFSCTHHSSGFPGGSAGRFFVMPLRGDIVNGRPFSHGEEVAEPGYYKVRLKDDGTVVEAVATVRTGIFRITFPGGVEPKIFVGDTAGSAFVFSEPFVSNKGNIYSFATSEAQRSILVRVSRAEAGAESAGRNIDKECVGSFETLRAWVAQEWRKALSVVEVEDDNQDNKTIFYTALYHSLLVPWVISDVDGYYRGADHGIHRVMGRNEYGNFSPWDSYRSLHPLLTLLYPKKQSEILQSLLDIYQQEGNLPVESMTGNHVVSIIVDAYRKGIRGIDKGTAYDAMLKSLVRGPFQQDDRAVYAEKGYIPLTHPESVTRTVEYGYDDWVLGQYARKVMGDKEMARKLEDRSMAYRHLLYPPSLLLLPREGDSFRVRPGNSGYKEGDAWVYSYFAPQDADGLIDRMGGDVDFSLRLDSALMDGRVVFDNETVLHVPYFFNAAGREDLTRKWVEKILKERYSDKPGGLPGNDDLGAMSSWYVFSAFGFFPFCPGEPVYSMGVPLFKRVVLHLAGRRRFVVRRGEGNGGWLLNGRAFDSAGLSHGTVVTGGELVYRPGGRLVVEKRKRPKFLVSDVRIAAAQVRSGEVNRVYFSLENKGVTGLKRLVLLSGGKAVGNVNCLVGEGQKVSDSLTFRLYQQGAMKMEFGDMDAGTVRVIAPAGAMPEPEVSGIDMRVMVREGDSLHLRYTVKNVGWERKQFRLPLKVDGEVRKVDSVLLPAGEEGVRSAELAGGSVGWHYLKIGIGEKVQRFRVYRAAEDAVVLDLDSVFRLGKDSYIRIAGNPGLGDLGERLTMMLWVYPEEAHKGLVDIFTNGDNHVLQVVDGRQLTFFAGGWGRGDNTVDLPADWVGHWHLIAGVCGADGLRVYIDGALKGFTPLEKSVHLFGGDNSWIIGRNEEFPGQRIFTGYVRRPRIFQEALSGEDILSIYRKERTNP